MAHRRALPRRRWDVWLLVPLAVALDAATALGLYGRPLPLHVVVPEAVLLAAPVLVYGTAAFIALRTWPPIARLAAAAVLLGLHAGLVALHAAAYVVLWSLPAPAALRLAHRWSPLVPLLQLLWVPLLALPLMTLADRTDRTDRHRRAEPPRRIPTRVPVEVLVARAAQAGPPARPQPDPRVHVELPRPGPVPEVVTEGAAAAAITVTAAPSATPVVPAPPVAPVAASLEVPASPIDTAIPLIVASAPEAIAETVPEVIEVRPPPPPSRESALIAPAPTWFDELLEASARSVPPAEPSPVPVPIRDGDVIDDAAPVPAVEPVVERHEPEIAPESIEPVQPILPVVAVPEAVSLAPLELVPSAPIPVQDFLPEPASVVMTPETADPDLPVEGTTPRIATPPLDLDLVARAFAPYGPLLSRDRAVQVEWIAGPDVPVVCAAAREMSRDRVARLAARLFAAVDPAVRRLSLRDAEGAIVLTPLDGAVMAAASPRRGAVALLEILSARLASVPGDGGIGAQRSDALAAAAEASSSGVHVETPAAALEVFAPVEIPAVPVGEVVGRLLAALATDRGGLETLQDLTVSFDAHRVVVHPLRAAGRPPRFVVIVGGPESPGLLGRRAERVARALVLAS